MRRVPIGELAVALHPRRNRWKALALLSAYFDESGTHDGSPVTAIAGYVGTKSAWEEIEEKWLAVLEPYANRGVRYFHMAECLAQKGQFGRIDRPNVNYIITQLSSLLSHPGIQGITSGVVTNDWNTVVTDPVFLQSFPKPFDLCFENIVRSLWEWARCEAEGESVIPMFAYHQDYQERMAEVGRVYGQHSWYRDVLGPIVFGYPEQVVPLQGADLLVHQFNGDVYRRVYGPFDLASLGPTKAMQQASGGRFMPGNWFDAEGLKLTVQRYLETGEI